MSNVHKRMKSGGGGGYRGRIGSKTPAKYLARVGLVTRGAALQLVVNVEYTQIHQIPNIREQRREGVVQRIKVRK
jgi:hypothetical protein